MFPPSLEISGKKYKSYLSPPSVTIPRLVPTAIFKQMKSIYLSATDASVIAWHLHLNCKNAYHSQNSGSKSSSELRRTTCLLTNTWSIKQTLLRSFNSHQHLANINSFLLFEQPKWIIQVAQWTMGPADIHKMHAILCYRKFTQPRDLSFDQPCTYLTSLISQLFRFPYSECLEFYPTFWHFQ